VVTLGLPAGSDLPETTLGVHGSDITANEAFHPGEELHWKANHSDDHSPAGPAFAPPGRGLHPLFAEYARALDDDPTAANGIQRRAAEWLRAHGMPVEAVEQASAAGNHDMVASMLVEHYEALVRGGAAATLLRWIRTLPDERVVEHPELTVAAAIAGGVGASADSR